MERTIISVMVLVRRCKGWSQGNVVDVVTRLWASQLWNFGLFPCRGRGFILNEISDFSRLQNVLNITEVHLAFCSQGWRLFLH